MFALIDAISNEFVHGQPLKGALKSRPPFEFNVLYVVHSLVTTACLGEIIYEGNFHFLSPMFSLEIPSVINAILSIKKKKSEKSLGSKYHAKNEAYIIPRMLPQNRFNFIVCGPAERRYESTSHLCSPICNFRMTPTLYYSHGS